MAKMIIKIVELKKTLLCHKAHNENLYIHLLFLYKYTVFYNIIQYFFKNELETLNTKISRGVCGNFFFIDKTSPIPPPYCVIALISRTINLIFTRTQRPRCPPPGSFHEKFTRKIGLKTLLLNTLKPQRQLSCINTAHYFIIIIIIITIIH